ncbi:hypothetical protein BaRGS_00025043 [Batillaria attramentaria]|uniref:Pescadillo homolog n=1 Tax=Batillaria attramentaria TaxID=370345 RepID=A0ABD0K9J9_9CAEN
MGKRKRKYESGAATTYISRNQAIRKLQLSLADFRRLCILKGVYPQEPLHKKKVNKGSTAPKTYYHVKDIQFLLHEPLIQRFREFKHFMRRLKKAVSKKNRNAEERIRANKPKYKLDKIVKERYPTYIDALRDLDDCLSMCFLFATFPVTKRTHAEMIHLCRRLTVEFQHYIIASGSLRKVFISIKGIYYQAEVMGQTLTWIVPHKLGYKHPDDVDYKIMSTFVDFYTTLLGFVNFRLYHSLNLHYPPQSESPLSPTGKGFVNFRLYHSLNLHYPPQSESPLSPTGKGYVNFRLYHSLNLHYPPQSESPLSPTGKGYVNFRLYHSLNLHYPPQLTVKLDEDGDEEILTNDERQERVEAMTQSLMAIGGDVQDEADAPDEFQTESGDPDYIEKAKVEAEDLKRLQTLFKDCKFFLNREVPRESLTFIIRSFGGQVSWDETLASGATYQESDETITHQIVDRPSLSKQYMSRHYVQPQWVFDSVNAKQLLPVEDYFMGAVLPPHLSPFVEEQDGDYVPPEKVKLLSRLQGKEQDVTEKASKTQKKSTKKRKMEKQPSSPPQKKTKHATVEEGQAEKVDVDKQLARQTAEERRLAEMMIPKKHKRLYHKIMYSKKKKTQEAQKLKEKRDAIDKAQKKQKKKAA